MKIKMLKSTPGAVNGGLDVKLFKKGLVYDTADMEGLEKVFLKIKAAEVHETPAEVERHEKGLTGAPENKRVVPVENKTSGNLEDTEFADPDPDDGDDIFTLEELEGSKAGDIRKLAKENGVDLSDFARNTAADVLIDAYLNRQ